MKIFYTPLVVLSTSVVNSQCLNTSPYGSATAPTGGAVAQISTCNYQTEYWTIARLFRANLYRLKQMGDM